MNKFAYLATTPKGKTISGQLDAEDEASARILLRARNLNPIRVVKVKGTSSTPSGFVVKGRISSRDLQIFTRQFSTLISAGIPILDSLKILGEGKKNPTLKEVLSKVQASIQQGKKLGDALGAHGNIFDRLYVNMVKAGEEAGILDGILQRLSVYLEKAEKIKKQIKSAMVYPVSIIVLALIVITGILIFIVPKFQELYKGKKELPALTQMVVDMSHFIIEKWYLVIAFILGVPFIFFQWYRSAEGRELVERFLIRAPVLGEVVQKAAIARMTRTLSTLLSAGVPVIDALEIAAKTAGNVVIEETLLRCKESVIQGKSIGLPLSKEKMIPDMVAQMVTIGEASGTLDTMLGKVADFYEDDVENAIKAATSLIEPVLMVVVGGFIAFLVIAIYLPIFDVASLRPE
ncbi:MAG: type II secretion system F family protein [Bdellovibrionaceae bacterium]|nr:type II secretion system F family protein [Pseudobdellovibrionaceae bacterium]MDW8189400.1 type II secretion system F family protein [Pseudobdellovibrionaceae bacterium]